MRTSKVLLKGFKMMEITGLRPGLPFAPMTGHSPMAWSSWPTLLTLQIFATPSHKLSPGYTIQCWDTNLGILMG